MRHKSIGLRAILISLALSLILFGFYTTWRTHNNSTDFDPYYFAAKNALSHSSVYTEHAGVSPYVYPPLFACLMAPLAFFNLEIASFIWYIFNVACAFILLLLCFRLNFDDKKISAVLGQIPFAPKILFLVVTCALLLDNLSMLQVNIMVVSLVLLGLYFFKKDIAILAGLFLALAISVKIIPALFLIYFAIKREFKICIFIVLWGVVFSLGVPSLFLGFGGALHDLILWGGDMLFNSFSVKSNHDTVVFMFNPENQSVTAFFFRWLVKNDFFIIHLKRMAHEYPLFLLGWTFSFTREAAYYLAKSIVFLMLIVTFVYCGKKTTNRHSDSLNFEYALIFLASLIANPILRIQQIVFIMFPSIFLLSRLNRRSKDYGLLYSGFLCFCFLYLLQAGRVFKILGAGTLSILCLWGLVLREYHKRQA